MRILYVLSGFGKASGGHFHSLNNIAAALDRYKDIEIDIASIGNVASPILKTNPNFLGNLTFNWLTFFTLNKKFKNLLKGRNIEIIHCYDGGTALLLMMLPALRKMKIMHTRCGGPNERNYFAQVLPTVILFSIENLNSFQKNPRFRQSDLHLISNRVNPVPVNTDALQHLLKKDPEFFTFLRIARIGKTYIQSIMQAIELVRIVREKNPKAKLVIIGVVEDQALLDQVIETAKAGNVPLELYTTKDYTAEASRFLYAADAVIGTGRGVMEAMSLGLPVFAPMKGRKLPAFVNEKTFMDLFTRNFSERSQLDFLSDAEIEREALQLVSEPKSYTDAQDFSLQKAREYFLLTTAIKEKYHQIYTKELQKKRPGLVSKNIIPILYYLNVYRKLAKRLPGQ